MATLLEHAAAADIPVPPEAQRLAGGGGPEPLRWDEYAATNAVAWDFRDEGEQRAQKMIRLLGCLEMGGGR